jgi:hypothetical protein
MDKKRKIWGGPYVNTLAAGCSCDKGPSAPTFTSPYLRNALGPITKTFLLTSVKIARNKAMTT